MDGILNILKPAGMTSFDVVAHLRGLLGIKKVGHTGTLDPLAVGVLPVCIGKATKAIEYLINKDKSYRAELTLGITTDTQDSSGKVLATAGVACTDSEIRQTVQSFVGKIMQLPPMYSALKVNGKRLYNLAREGAEVFRQRREIEVYSAGVIRIDRSDGVRVLLDAHCSKGTYIRTLCADIGERLGCGGHMSFLLRKRAGPFDISSAITLEELAFRKRNKTVEEALTGVESVFAALTRYDLDEKAVKKFKNGMAVAVSSSYDAGSLIRVYSASGEFTALGTVHNTPDGVFIKAKKFF